MTRFAPWLMIPLAVIPAAAQSPAQPSPEGRRSVRNEPLRQELLVMMQADQAARFSMLQTFHAAGVPIGAERPHEDAGIETKLQAAKRAVKQQDERNRSRLRAIVTQYGWPGKSLVGTDGAHASWLLVQHGDADRMFQQTCLNLMSNAPQGEVDGVDVAYLTDRVLIGDKKPQRFGTQFDANFKPLPLEDETKVDERRAALGLPPLAQAIKEARAMYQPTPQASPRGKAEQQP